MNCETLQTAIPELLYGSLPDAEAQAANAHLARCEGCNRLVSDLRPIPGSLSKPAPPPDLATQLKLAARDELLERQQLTGRSGPLHLVATIVLALCLALVGFALGVRYQRTQTGELDTPGTQDDGDGVEITHGDGDGTGSGSGDPREIEGAEALQRMLVEAAQGYLQRRELERAKDYFSRAQDVAPRGPSAAEARAGEAEVLLELGGKQRARELLRETRALIIAGDLSASADLLQKIYDLEARTE